MKRAFPMLALVAGATFGAGMLASTGGAEARVCVSRHHDLRGTCARWAPGFGPGAFHPGRPGLVAHRCRWVAVAVPTPWGVRVERQRICRF